MQKQSIAYFVLNNKISTLQLTVCWLCLAPLVVLAQEPQASAVDDAITQVLQHEQQREEASRISADPDEFFPRPKKRGISYDFRKTAKCYKIKKVELKHATLLKGKRLKKLIEPYLGLCLNQVNINGLMSKISNYYIGKGYVTSRALISEQDLTDGTLELKVLEGKFGRVILNKVRGRSGKVKKKRFEDKTAFPFLKDDLLNLRDIEMGIERINRLSSHDAKSQLFPGERPGYSDLGVLNTTTKPWHVKLSVDNHGREKTGENQLSGTLIWDSPLGINDLLVANLNGVHKQESGRKTLGNSLAWSFPVGYWLFDFSYSKFKYRQTLSGLNEIFRSSGDNVNYKASTDYMFHRNQNSKSIFGLAVTRKKSRNFIEDVFIDVSSRKLTVGTLSWSHSRLLKDGKLEFSAARHDGLTWFDAERNLGNDFPKAQFKKYAFDFSYLKQFKFKKTPIGFNTRFHSQQSHDNLYGSEQISIGGLYTVRGFDDDSSLSGNSGWYAQNELYLIFPVKNKFFNKWLLTKVSPYISYDIGRIKSDEFVSVNGKLSGRGIGIRMSGKYLSIDLHWARPNEMPGDLPGPPPDRVPVNFADGTVFNASLHITF